MKKIIIFLFFVIQTFAQDNGITVLKPNQSFSSKDSVIVVTLTRWAKIDSAVRTYQNQITNYQKDSVVYSKGLALSDSIQKKLILVQQKNNLLMTKDTIRIAIDTLLNENIRTYQAVIKDLQNTLTKDKGSSGGFFNNTFWFGTGAVVGVAVVYISSEILKSIK
jgi:hypothetical protein